MLGKVIVVLLIGVCGVYIGISYNEINQSTKREVKGKYYEELGLVGIKGGEFLMGSDSTEAYAQDFEGPVRKVFVDSFQIQRTEVTNEMFQKFIQETGYIPEAERFGWSFVVETFLSEVENQKATEAVAGTPWWIKVHGATWNHPEGQDSSIITRMKHPVVHTSWNDAISFCEYYGMRLPSEAEWEYAARGGLEQKNFPWGNERMSKDRQHLTNIFQGEFPYSNTEADGFKGTSPVGSFPPNNFGLYDVSGNVWEWTSDIFYGSQEPMRVCKGGSFMCHRKFCYRYRCSSRRGNSPDTTAQNLGFRCAL